MAIYPIFGRFLNPSTHHPCRTRWGEGSESVPEKERGLPNEGDQASVTMGCLVYWANSTTAAGSGKVTMAENAWCRDWPQLSGVQRRESGKGRREPGRRRLPLVAVHEFLRRPLAEARRLPLREWGVVGLIENKSDRFRARACIVSGRRRPGSRGIQGSARRVIRSNDHPCENDGQCSSTGGGKSEGHDERSWRSVCVPELSGSCPSSETTTDRVPILTGLLLG